MMVISLFISLCILFICGNGDELNQDPRIDDLGRQIIERNIRRGLTNPNVLSTADKQQILDLHNEIRSEVARGIFKGPGSTYQPSACNMNALSWSVGLEKLATEWSGRCQFQYDTNSNRKQRLANYVDDIEWEWQSTDSAGENIHMSSLDPRMNYMVGDKNWGILGAVGDSWSRDQSKLFTYSSTRSGSCSGVCGGYTQVVWAKTRYVGCGFRDCNSQWNCFLTCNYYPAGNWYGQSPYKQGKACSCCEADRNTCSHQGGLCGGGMSSQYNLITASEAEKRTIDQCSDNLGRNLCLSSPTLPDANSYYSWFDGDEIWWRNLKVIVITTIIFNIFAYSLTYTFCLNNKVKHVYKTVTIQDVDVVTE